ncbi:hypothetical protein DUZ99_14050 [Xylanibacillus composti]|uniref:Uncharacterized protein n=1 Tax=Xylanibacillus composti TaxID=1572762 RepID=A0A8J4M2B6_9BACL|nr:hypothetical protein [Xylanibacillus composti]MDT9726101.1 hypothetical protein [Xylanibacillus composti]GIQ68752.1 hypothetical protein XYCOK13_15760 [Xylanibacillus composti]
MKNFGIFLLLFASNAAYLTLVDWIMAGNFAEAIHTVIHSFVAITMAEQLMISLYIFVPAVTAFIRWWKARSTRAS